MNKFTLPQLASGLLLAVLAAGAQAAEVSQKTDTVKGRAPVASNVVISNQSTPGAVPWVGQVLEGAYSFNDSDGDVESGTTFQWLRNGVAIGGATASTYTAQSADSKQTLSVRVTPKTDPTITDPANGVAVTTAGKFIAASGIINRFLKPEPVLRNWSAANSYCQSQGARLPSQAELQKVLLDSTPITALGQDTNAMQSLYGWPLALNELYWSSTVHSTGRHYSVSMRNGISLSDRTDDRFEYYAACIR